MRPLTLLHLSDLHIHRLPGHPRQWKALIRPLRGHLLPQGEKGFNPGRLNP